MDKIDIAGVWAVTLQVLVLGLMALSGDRATLALIWGVSVMLGGSTLLSAGFRVKHDAQAAVDQERLVRAVMRAILLGNLGVGIFHAMEFHSEQLGWYLEVYRPTRMARVH
jgi:hypothetical protein